MANIKPHREEGGRGPPPPPPPPALPPSAGSCLKRRARQIPRGNGGVLVSAESSSVTELKESTRHRDRDSDVVDSQRINKHADTLGTTAVFERGNNKRALHVLRRYPKRRRNNNNNVQTETAEEPPITKKGNGNSNSIFSEKARACTECGKEFSSWKALFGHMRCHPEREWRGINPPQDVRQQRQHMMMMTSIITAGEPQAAAGQSFSSVPPAPPHPPRSHLRNHLKFHKRQTEFCVQV